MFPIADQEISREDARKQLLAALGSRPEWAALTEYAKELMDQHFAKVTRHFMNEGEAPDYDRLQWQRGVFAGIKFMLDNPTLEAKKLERLLARQRPDDTEE